MDQTA